MFSGNTSVAQEEEILAHERKRLGIPDDVPNDVIGFKIIKESQNLVNLIQSGRMKVILYASNKDQVKCYITNSGNAIRAKINPGQFIPSKEKNYQYLITRKGQEWEIPPGQSTKDVQTFCFDKELQSPSEQQYKLGTIQVGHFREDMNQTQVWQLKFKLQALSAEYTAEKSQWLQKGIK